MSLGLQFNEAAEKVKNLKQTPADADLIEVYSFYKQSTVGDVNTDRPGMLDFKGKAKWDGWNSKKGMSKDDAMKAYVAKVDGLVSSIGLEA